MALIIECKTQNEFTAAKNLFIAYQQFLNVDLCFQSFNEELNNLQAMYSAPTGSLLLAVHNNNYIGCVAVRKMNNTDCEMKRLYLLDEYKGLGIGKQLVNAIMQKAAQLGYKTIKLDTLPKLDKAIDIYKKIGFKETTAYYNNPTSGVVYMQASL
jgi:putative acetyltransferase